jgi:hypothetical protein
LQSGSDLADQPVVNSVSFPDSGLVRTGYSLRVEISISDTVPTALMKIFFVVDDDVSGIAGAADNLLSGSYEVFLYVPSFSLSIGQHNATFYVVNDVGFVSDPVGRPFEVIPMATPTTAQSPTITPSPLPSRTLAPYSNPFPSIYPLSFTWYTRFYANFDIYWADVDDIRTSYDGYSTVLRVNNWIGEAP